MSRRYEVVWPVPAHTRAKHAILRYYLDAWLPIMTTYHRRVLYIDGFAGPGRYRGGEDGSPIVAIKAALQHPRRIPAEIVYVFIEADAEREANLRRELANLLVPSNIHVDVRHSTFDETLTEMLDQMERSGGSPPPTFAFVDP